MTATQTQHPIVAMESKFGSISGKLKFLADQDLGSITKNETAQELLEDIKVLHELVRAVEEKQKESFRKWIN